MQPNYAPPNPYPMGQYPTTAPQLPQQYGQPVYPQQPYAMPPGYPQPTMAPPPQPLAQGSIDDFYSQPAAGGGAFLKFEYLGQSYDFLVARAITSGDIRQQTTPPNQGSVPQFYRDGRPKFEMVVPVKLFAPTQANPDGLGSWAVRGADRDELNRAMAEAGAPEGPPEAGAFIRVTYVQSRQGRGAIPQKVKSIYYARPGAQPNPPQVQIQQPAQPQYAPQPQAPQQYAPPVAPQVPAAPAFIPPATPAPQPVQQAPAPQPAAQPVTSGLTPEQQALYAQLTAQNAAAGR